MAGQSQGEVLMEGVLSKRQRGRRSSDLQRLKFQERSCRLTASSFEYYKGRKLRGQFLLTRVRIVEQVLQDHSRRKYCFQIGDSEEVMYLAAKSNDERTTWMQSFKKAAASRGNEMLDQYHLGVYGSPIKNQWSCCHGSQRTCKGCQSIHQSLSKTRTFPLQRTKPPQAKRARARSAEILPGDYEEPRKTTVATTHSLQPVPEIDVIVTSPDLEDDHESVPVRTTRSRANTHDSGLGSSITGSKNVEDFYLDSEDEVSDDEKFPYLFNIPPSSYSQAVTALAFYGSDLVSGSRDRHVLKWDTSLSMVVNAVKVSNSVLALDVWSHFLAIGSTTIQLVDMCSKNLKRIMVVDMGSAENEDPLKEPALNLVAYVGAEGMLASASVTGSVVKLWDPPSTDEGIIQSPRNRISLCESEECSIWSLSASRNPSSPWVAVGVHLERKHKPIEKKVVNLIDCRKSPEYCYSIQAGYGAIHTAFLPDGKHLAIGCFASVDIHDTMTGNKLYQCSTDGTISSLFCYLTQSRGNLKPHVAVGLATGEVQVFEANKMRAANTIPKPEIQTAATAIAYSEDMEALTVGYQNGKIHLWKAPDPLDCHAMQKAPEPINQLVEREFRPETIFTRMEQQTFGYEGGQHISEADKYELIIPEGAIPKSTRITVEFGVSPYGPFGPFKYPDGCQPVSAIVWFCANPSINFLKPVEIKLPHFANCGDGNNCKALAFFKADHNQKSDEMFHFNETEGELSSTLNPDQISYASLHTNHFCMYCVCEYERSDTKSANYFLVIARPRHISPNRRFQIHCCLTYMLPTCLRLISEQLSDGNYHTEKKIVRFADANPHTLKISLDKDDVEPKGWLVSLVSDEEIDTEEVCFWDGFDCKSLVLACKESMYPPRFTVEVSAGNATKSGNLKIKFGGGRKQLSTEIPLELQEPKSEGTTDNSELVVGNSLDQSKLLSDHHHIGNGNPTHLMPSPVPLPPVTQHFHGFQ